MKGKGERMKSEECMMLALVSYLINSGMKWYFQGMGRSRLSQEIETQSLCFTSHDYLNLPCFVFFFPKTVFVPWR